MLSLNKQIWINQLMDRFYADSSFLSYIGRDMSTLVDNDKINLAEAGVSPNVLINNTTYPIATTQRVDTPLEITLDLFETENTLIRRPEVIEYSYDQMENVLLAHRESLRVKTAEKAAHAIAPQSDAAFTPVVKTTGANNGEGKKRLTVADILKLKRRFDDLDIPFEDRYLVLHPAHMEDLILADFQAFKSIADLTEGKPLRFAGFGMLQFTKNPYYIKSSGQKLAFGTAIVPATHTFCSFGFHAQEVMKADGDVHMYSDIDNPKERGTIVGFDKRFIAMPVRNKAIGSILADDAV